MRKLVLPIIEANYENLSPTDKNIADFFISNKEKLDFSADKISSTLYVSKSALTRFSKKIGFEGYREFISFYNEELNNRIDHKFNSLTQKVLFTYQEIVEKSYSLIDEEQINRVIKLITDAKKVYVYGVGNSGLSAQEFKMRFMRIGLDVEALTDVHLMNMNEVLISKDNLLIALSISGYPLKPYIIDAKGRGAKVIALTTNMLNYLKQFSNEIIMCPSVENLDVGNIITPQLPFLLILDVIYAFYLSKDINKKTFKLEDTLKHIQQRHMPS